MVYIESRSWEGAWEQLEKDFETPPEFASQAIRDYHRQMLALTGERLESVPLEKRELGYMVFAVNDSLVPELKNLVRQFQKDAVAIIERSSNKNTVYTLNTQLLPVFKENSV